jgi:hypothetical protein
MRITGCRAGLLINFNTPTVIDGVKRFVLKISVSQPVLRSRIREGGCPLWLKSTKLYEEPDLFPIVMILVILIPLMRYLLKKNKPQQQRWLDHMDRMEQKYDRIIELMEKMIDSKK